MMTSKEATNDSYCQRSACISSGAALYDSAQKTCPVLTTYEATFRRLVFPREDLHRMVCFLPISIGQEYHEGAKLVSIIRLVNRTFTECRVIISDALHRHNILASNPGMGIETATRHALMLGQEWVARNGPLFEEFSIPWRFVHWDELLGDPAYAVLRPQLDARYANDQVTRRLVDTSVEAFVEGHCLGVSLAGAERARVANHCLEYVLEEHTIQLVMIPARMPDHHFAYPHTNRLDPLDALYHHWTGRPCRWLRLRIRRKD